MQLTKTAKGKVYSILLSHPATRDSDPKLLAMYWAKELIDANTSSTMPAYKLLDMLRSKKITNPETVRRWRQKIQEETPALRGKVYKKRLERQEAVKQALGYNTGEQIQAL